MDSFNKIISFVLGLVVVIVFFAVVTGRINFKGGIPRLVKPSVTPTMSPTPSNESGSKVVINPTSATGRYQQQAQSQKKTTQIPATGLPTLFIPSLMAAASAGAFLRKTGKK
jgi:hypothetical protein